MAAAFTHPAMHIPLAVFSFIFGLIWGSFLNVCIYRIPAGKSIVHPPSSCPKCGHQIHWYENIPVFSWLLLRAKCSGCHEPISMIYPLVEMLTGVLFLFAYLMYGFSIELPFIMAFVASMIVASGIDIHVQIIPDRIVLPGIVLGLIYGALSPKLGFWMSFAGACLGGGGLLLVIFIFYLVTKKIGMGGGDVKLLAMIGAFTGPEGIPVVLFLASTGGILFFIIMKLVFRKKIIAGDITAEDIQGSAEDLSRVIYFGPFLAAAAVIVLLFMHDPIRFLFLY